MNKYEEAFKEFLEKNDFTYGGGYINKRSKVKIICNKCGNEMNVQAETFNKYKKCTKCGHIAIKEQKEKNTFEDRLKENNIELLIYQSGKKSLSCFKCSKGHIFVKTNDAFRETPTCPECAKERRAKQRYQEYVRRLKENGLTPLTEFYTATDKFACQCEQGHIMWTNILNLNGNYECSICNNERMSKDRRFSIDEVKQILKEKGFEYVSGEYKNQYSQILAKCYSGHFIKNNLNYFKTISSCPECRVGGFQKMQYQLLEDIEKMLPNEDIVLNDREVLDGKEIDIYIPSKKIGIELDGVYWHSQKDKKYHLEKTKLANEKGIKLLHFWDVEYSEKKEIVLNMIRSKLGLNNRIYGRNTRVKVISKNVAKEFLNKYHINGYHQANFCIGLYYKGELYAAAAFSKSRYNKQYKFELNRYALKPGFTIIGGFGKIIKKYKKMTNNAPLITYVDIRFSGVDPESTVYAKNKMEFIGYTEPNYFYLKDHKIHSRIEFQKHKLKDKLEVFYPELTEIENMTNNGYRIVYDCGNMKFDI